MSQRPISDPVVHRWEVEPVLGNSAADDLLADLWEALVWAEDDEAEAAPSEERRAA